MSKQHPKDHTSRTTRVTGIGGVFFKAEDPGKLISLYTNHLGIKPESEGSSAKMLQWREKDDAKRVGYTVSGQFFFMTRSILTRVPHRSCSTSGSMILTGF